jgi:hypothetical protein
MVAVPQSASECADAETRPILPRRYWWFHIKGASSNTATASTDEIYTSPANFAADNDVAPVISGDGREDRWCRGCVLQRSTRCIRLDQIFCMPRGTFLAPQPLASDAET